jgi:hypothetical protein
VARAERFAGPGVGRLEAPARGRPRPWPPGRGPGDDGGGWAWHPKMITIVEDDGRGIDASRDRGDGEGRDGGGEWPASGRPPAGSNRQQRVIDAYR